MKYGTYECILDLVINSTISTNIIYLRIINNNGIVIIWEHEFYINNINSNNNISFKFKFIHNQSLSYYIQHKCQSNTIDYPNDKINKFTYKFISEFIP